MKSYQEECVALESTQWHEPNRRLLHVAMGLVTETAELLNFTSNKNFLEELGDIYWYIAVGCDVFETTIHEAFESNGQTPLDLEDDLIEVMITEAAEIMDVLKKNIFYGRPFDSALVVRRFGRIIEAIAICAEDLDTNLEEVEICNLDKLHRRYKDKVFTETEANNRDVVEEMKAYS